MHGQLGPTVLRVDGAVSEMEAAIDWAAIARAWPSAPGPHFKRNSPVVEFIFVLYILYITFYILYSHILYFIFQNLYSISYIL